MQQPMSNADFLTSGKPTVLPALPKSASVANLDFLRAAAVLFVLADHTFNALGYSPGQEQNWLSWLGRTGVLFFFVHTCCVLLMSLERHKGEGFFSTFYLRRLFRIYPLSIVGVLIAMVSPHHPSLTKMEFLSNLALVQNLTFSRNAFGTIWTLPLEVQMYLFLPFIFLLIRRFRTLWVPLALFALSIPVALWQPNHVARATILAFVPAFLPGAIAFVLFGTVRPRLRAWGFPIAIVVITVAFLSRPGWQATAWAACFALGISLPLFHQLSRPAVKKAAFTIAKYSYGVYISHTLILMWMTPTWKTLPLYLLAVAACSVLAYHLVEHPMIRLGHRITSARKRSAEMIAASA